MFERFAGNFLWSNRSFTVFALISVHSFYLSGSVTSYTAATRSNVTLPSTVSIILKSAGLPICFLLPNIYRKKTGPRGAGIRPRLLNYFFGFAKHSTDQGYFQGGKIHFFVGGGAAADQNPVDTSPGSDKNGRFVIFWLPKLNCRCF